MNKKSVVVGLMLFLTLSLETNLGLAMPVTSEETRTSQIIKNTTTSETADLIETMRPKPKAILSGTWGTSSWAFDDESGVLTVGSGSLGEFGTQPWRTNASIQSHLIKKIVFTGPVTAPVDSGGLFSAVRTAEKDDSRSTYGLSGLTVIEGLTYLDTSNVTNMTAMFYKAGQLESLDLSKFDTHNVTSMQTMFTGTYKLQALNLSGFNTSKVTTMAGMFESTVYYAQLPALDLHHFDTSNVTTMARMFWGQIEMTSLDISNFNTSKVTDFSGMFGHLRKLPTLTLPKTFTTETATNMKLMFASMMTIETLDIKLFDTSQVTDMSGMFSSTTNLKNIDVSHFDTSQVVEMGQMFRTAGVESLDLRNFDTSQVTDMNSMFMQATQLRNLDISSFNTSNVTNMNGMFSGTVSLPLDITHFDTRQVTNMHGMFRNVSAYGSLDLSNFDTSNVTLMDNMFRSASIEQLNIANFDPSKATLTNMFTTNLIPSITLGEKFPSSLLGKTTYSTNRVTGYATGWLGVSTANKDLFYLNDTVFSNNYDTTKKGTYIWAKTLTLEVKNSGIKTGDSWTASDNFLSATNEFGTAISTDKLTVTGTVNTAKAGTYQVTYEYSVASGYSISKTATITVTDPPPPEPTEAKVSVYFFDESYTPLKPTVELVRSVGTTVDLTTEPQVVDTITAILQSGYTIDSRPVNEASVFVTSKGTSLMYMFKGTLSLTSAPNVIDFGLENSGSYGEVTVEKPSYDQGLIVKDTRKSKTTWKLTAKVTEVMTSVDDSNYTLPEALIYKTGTTEEVLGLNDSKEIINHSGGSYDVSQEEWENKDNGFKLKVSGDQYRTMGEYKATILFTVSEVY